MELTNEEKIAQLKEFCPTGESFDYLGVEMTVVSHFHVDYGYDDCKTRKVPKLACRYVSGSGQIQDQSFDYFELKTLKRLASKC